jgi:hypothetical protein
MRLANRILHSGIFGAIASVVLASVLPARAQTYTVGQPAVGKYNGGSTTTSTLATDGSYWDASQFNGSPVNDLCGKINAAWSASIAAGFTGATIDARGLTGPQACSLSPFPGGASGKLLLGNTVITTSVTWQIPARVHVEGIGVAPLVDTTTANTTIRSGSVTGAVVQLGDGNSLSFDAQVSSLTVDAHGVAAIGILNDSSQEGSVVQDVNIFNAPGTGLLIESLSSTLFPNNSGPYRNINVQYEAVECSTCGTSTVGIAVMNLNGGNVGIVRGIDNVTVSGAHLTSGIGSCVMVINYPVQITNSHVEFCSTGIQIGGPGSDPETNNVEVQNVSTYTGPSAWGITVSRAADVLLSGITALAFSSSANQVLEDSVTGNTITGTATQPYYLGYYLLGDTSSGSSSPAVISTTATGTGLPVKWVAPGNLQVVGTFSKGGGTFKIDDPLDPANKYLYHSFVESPDMMNVYNGSITTDKRGMAVVTLPDYFSALNRDFRYQLTAIGTFAQATVAKKIENNRFAIRTSKPGVEVSWQVTGIRHDTYANAHRIQVEEQKPPREQGHYLHPELFEGKGKQVDAEEAGSK